MEAREIAAETSPYFNFDWIFFRIECLERESLPVEGGPDDQIVSYEVFEPNSEKEVYSQRYS